ncbi:hypothetical protein BCF74_11356 [Knoellia remsis]|uniref:Uncharacterized protein n=1 Tax=Knoellia remsis TaxID=407159 RepID=A0A2T0UJN8_9MICO|nr:hypothetical protein BCF74_11356 [Knoellia remsis]
MQHLPEDIDRELERVVRRWRELPVDRALGASGDVRALVDELAAATAPGSAVPDLGPSVLMDQLRVLAWDAAVAGVPDLVTRLAALRRALP